jgi:hypothetical protein
VTWQPLNLAAPEYATPPEPPSLVGLIYRGKRHLVSGPPEALKTMFCYIVALEHIRAGGVAAIVDLEMGPVAARTLLAELGASEAELADVYYVEPDAPPTEADLEAMLAAGVTLAIVDSAAGAYALSGLDDNQRKDAETWARTWLHRLWQAGVTTLTIDHVAKDVDGRGKWAIGSERKVGGVDVHLGLHVVRPLSRGSSGLVRITAHKDRPGFLARQHAAAELEIDSEAYTNALTWTFREASGEDGGWRPTLLMERVLEYLAKHPEPVSRSTLANAVRGKRQFVLQAIDELLTEGRLALQGGKVVPVPGTFPVRELPTKGNGNVPRSSLLQGERERERLLRPSETGDDDIPF